MTPLVIGAQNGYNEVVELVLKGKVNKAQRGNATVIYIASKTGHSVVISITVIKPGMFSAMQCTPLVCFNVHLEDRIVADIAKGECIA